MVSEVILVEQAVSEEVSWAQQRVEPEVPPRAVCSLGQPPEWSVSDQEASAVQPCVG